MTTRRLRAVIVTVAVGPLAFALPAAAHVNTTATVFRPFTAKGKPTIHTRSKSGYCWTGSDAVNRDDAWRCFVGNFIYDPCFSSRKAHGVVVCPDATLSRGIEIHLTKRLPYRLADHGKPSTRNQPWIIELTNGVRFVFASGATSVVQGHRLNYFCAKCGYGLWGSPRRRTEPWTILAGPLNATRLHKRRAIRQVWM